MRAKTAAAKAVCTAGPRAGAVPTAEDEAILAPIIAQIALERDKGASRGSEQWGCVEEREEAQSWKHATALANELPESCIAQLLGGPAAAAQVPCARERVDIAVSAIRRRGGPDGAGSRLALIALRTLAVMAPEGVPPLPATPAFIASCKRRVDSAARIKYANRKQGGATAVLVSRRSLADVDDCWRVGLLQQINAPGASVACLEPRAHLNGYESQSQLGIPANNVRRRTLDASVKSLLTMSSTNSAGFWFGATGWPIEER